MLIIVRILKCETCGHRTDKNFHSLINPIRFGLKLNQPLSLDRQRTTHEEKQASSLLFESSASISLSCASVKFKLSVSTNRHI